MHNNVFVFHFSFLFEQKHFFLYIRVFNVDCCCLSFSIMVKEIFSFSKYKKKHLFFLKYFSLYIVCCPFSNKLLLLLFYCCLQFHFLTLCTLCSFNIVYVCVFVCMCSCANVLSRYLPSCLPLHDSILNLFPLTSLP